MRTMSSAEEDLGGDPNKEEEKTCQNVAGLVFSCSLTF
jgi:hypothetical protein